MDPKAVLEFAAKNNAKMLDLRFTDLPGLWQHVSYPIGELEEGSFKDGFGFDASSIRGWQSIHESDMLLIPGPRHRVHGPVPRHAHAGDDLPTPSTRSRKKPYRAIRATSPSRPRPISKKPASPTQAFFGAEAEFFIFDSIRFDSAPQHGFYYIDSDEGRWNTGREEHNLGYRPRYKEGYFPAPPMDHFQDLRTDMVLQMQAVRPGHRVPSPRSGHRRPVRNRSALQHAAEIRRQHDEVQVRSVKSVANQYGKTVTFMPKPIFGDNGSGMHTHQSLWTRRQAALRRRQVRGPFADGAVVRRRTAQARPAASRPSSRPPPIPTSAWCPATKLRSTWPTPAATAPPRCASRCIRTAPRPSASSSVRPTHPAIPTWRSPPC